MQQPAGVRVDGSADKNSPRNPFASSSDEDSDEDMSSAERAALRRLQRTTNDSSAASASTSQHSNGQAQAVAPADITMTSFEIAALQRLYELHQQERLAGGDVEDAVELRIDPADGNAYEFEDFLDFYGLEAADRWAKATPLDGAQLEKLQAASPKQGGAPQALEQGVQVIAEPSTGAKDSRANSQHTSADDVDDSTNSNAAPAHPSLWQSLDPALFESIVDDITLLRDFARKLRHERKVRRLQMQAYDPDAKRQPNVGNDGNAGTGSSKIDYNLPWKVCSRVTAHSSSVTCLCLADGGGVLVSGSDGGDIRLWVLTETLQLRPMNNDSSSGGGGGSSEDVPESESDASGTLLAQEGGAIRCLASIGTSSPLVASTSASEPPCIKIWDVRARAHRQTLRGHTDTVSCLSCALSFGSGASAAVLISGSEDHSLKVWETNSGTCIRTMKGHHDAVWSVCCPPADSSTDTSLTRSTVFSGSWDCTIRLWEYTTGECKAVVRAAHQDGIWALCYLGALRPADNAPVASQRRTDGRNFGPDAEWGQAIQEHLYIATASWDKTVKVWDISTRPPTVVHTLKNHTFSVTSVAPVPGTPLLVSTSEDRSVRVWNADTGNALAAMMPRDGGHSDGVRCAVTLSDGETLVTGGWDKRVVVWQARRGGE